MASIRSSISAERQVTRIADVDRHRVQVAVCGLGGERRDECRVDRVPGGLDACLGLVDLLPEWSKVLFVHAVQCIVQGRPGVLDRDTGLSDGILGWGFEQIVEGRLRCEHGGFGAGDLRRRRTFEYVRQSAPSAGDLGFGRFHGLGDLRPLQIGQLVGYDSDDFAPLQHDAFGGEERERSAGRGIERHSIGELEGPVEILELSEIAALNRSRGELDGL